MNGMEFPIEEARVVYEEFSDTEYGKYLMGAARYERFRPKGYAVKYWGRLLGSDVNNLRHMHHSISVARWFIKTENSIRHDSFSRQEARLLGVTAALHDQAESLMGDIPYGHKSGVQRTNEVKGLRDHEKDFEPHLKGTSLALYRLGRDQIAFGDTKERLPGAFRAIELIGFAENALHAQRKTEYLKRQPSFKEASYFGVTTEDDREQLVIALERLSTEVFGSGIIEQLILYGDRFPSAHVYLRRHATQIQQGMNEVSPDVFAWYDVDDPYARIGERERRTKSFYSQKDLWENWLS